MKLKNADLLIAATVNVAGREGGGVICQNIYTDLSTEEITTNNLKS